MIDVLLATYHPDRPMLEAQLKSIRGQQGVVVNLIQREDVEGEGACANFAKLLDVSNSEYCAFSDQDDIWRSDKLACALAKMREMESLYGSDVPILVFSDATVVDSGLNELNPSLFNRTKIDPSRIRPEQLILQNVANGNTMLFNAALREKAKPIPKDAFMHDHWIMLVASVFGKIACLNEATVLYRQHEKNVLGGPSVGFGYFLMRFRQGYASLRKRLYANIRQVEAFVERFGDDSPECFKALVGIDKKPWFFRIAILLRHRILKTGLLRNIGTFAII